MFVSTDLEWPETIATLDELSPGHRWLLDDGVEIGRPRCQAGGSALPPPVEP